MTSRDLVFISAGTLLASIGIASTLLSSESVGMISLFLLGLLILFVLILQRRTQALVQERLLYLVRAEKDRGKPGGECGAPNSSVDSNAVLEKKLVGLLQAQQISMEKLRSEINSGSDRNK